MLPQSSWIAAFLGVGFIVYITAKGQLPSYLAVLFGSTQASAETIATQQGVLSSLQTEASTPAPGLSPTPTDTTNLPTLPTLPEL